ncbi:MAG: DUF3179 domain-containing protein, partial [Myxococcales bacterium]|nr:DUF3179 domain-containing protein [Myxococcales bacterium]
MPKTRGSARRALWAMGAAVAWSLVGSGSPAPAETRNENGFDLSPSSIPVDQILRGGPPRDGIPALVDPEVSADPTTWPPETSIVGVVIDGKARAYPIALLNWHELVNDRLGEQPILVSYCPLCGTAMVFSRRFSNGTHEFGVSGLLYRSDLLMYDRTTDSLWSQISAEAVTGPSLGKRLTLLPSRMMRWGDWQGRHEASTILTRATGYPRDYDRSPYGGYNRSEELAFPARFDPRYHPKMPTLGFRHTDGRARAYPAAEVLEVGSVKEEFAGSQLSVRFDASAGVFENSYDGALEVVDGFWFAWSAFH